MATRPDPLAILKGVLADLGGARRVLASIGALSLFALAVFMPVPAAYELWMVHQVQGWREVPVRLDAVELRRPTFGKGRAAWRYTVTAPATGQTREIGDAEPGDLPFTALGWSTEDARARDYASRIGRTIRVRRSPDGTRLFLHPGTPTTMTVTLALCALYWSWLLAARRRRQPRPAP